MRFSPVRVLSTPHSGWLECWEPDDLLLLRKITRRLQPRIQAAPSRNCFHLKGHGGAKGALQAIRRLLDTRRYSFVARSDAKGYYANIRHRILLAQVREHCDHSPTLRLVQQYCARTLVKDGYYHEVERKGSLLGCPLSPLMGALYLSPLDKALENLPRVKYLRFMDDWIILAESRWKLRRAVRIMNQVLADLELDQHPDKTFIGKVSCGFDFLGVGISTQRKRTNHTWFPANPVGSQRSAFRKSSKNTLPTLLGFMSKVVSNHSRRLSSIYHIGFAGPRASASHYRTPLIRSSEP